MRFLKENMRNMLSLCIKNYNGTTYNDSKDILNNIIILHHYGFCISLSTIISLWAYFSKKEKVFPLSNYLGYTIYII